MNGYRKAAGMAAPGKPLGGWCDRTSDTVLGQWFQGMTRMAKATGDVPLREKAVRLFTRSGRRQLVRMGIRGWGIIRLRSWWAGWWI